MKTSMLTLALAAAAHTVLATPAVAAPAVAAPASASAPASAAALSIARQGARLTNGSALGEKTGEILGIIGGAITAIGALLIAEDDDDPDSD